MGLLIVLVLVVLLVVGLPPVTGHWHQWGYGPSGLLGVVLVIVLVLVLLGRL